MTAPVESGLTFGVNPVPATGMCFPEPAGTDEAICIAVVDVPSVEKPSRPRAAVVSGLPAAVYGVTASRGRRAAHAAIVILPGGVQNIRCILRPKAMMSSEVDNPPGFLTH